MQIIQSNLLNRFKSIGAGFTTVISTSPIEHKALQEDFVVY